MWQKTIDVYKKEEMMLAVTDYLCWKTENQLESKSESLFVGACGMSQEEAREWLQPLRDIAPDMPITIMSMMSLEVLEVSEGWEWKKPVPMLRLDFNAFRESQVEARWYPLSDDYDKCMEEVEEIRKDFATKKGCKAVNICCIGILDIVSDVLENLKPGNEKLVIFGAMAYANFEPGRDEHPFLECSMFPNEKMERGVFATFFCGENLQVYGNYAFGWKPIGKGMFARVKNKTKKWGDRILCKLDDNTMEEVYRKYLGIEFDEYFAYNAGEFPFMLEREGMQIGRSPVNVNDKGEVIFFGNITEDERLNFTYALPGDVLEETLLKCREMEQFQPEMVQIMLCPVRTMVLRSDAKKEIELYRSIHEDTFFAYGGGEIFINHGRGGMLNCTLVAVGMSEREEAELPDSDTELNILERKKGVVPQPTRMLHYMRAMTNDMRELMEQANAANAAKTAFLSHMSHEIRTPINAILGMNEMILRECKEDGIFEYADNIDNAGKTLLALVNDVLDFSKIEQGKMEIIPVEYELGSFFNDVKNMIETRAMEKNLEFIMDVDENIPHILYGDEIRIKECLINILTNAVKYTEKGKVIFSCSHQVVDENHILLKICVEDTGKGIRPEDLDSLFTPFQRIEEKKNRHIEGTGLGMNITKQLLEMMGSGIEVESVYGKGSKFSFEIEQEVRSLDPIGELANHYHNQQGGDVYHALFEAPDAKILIVDDMKVNLLVITNLLKQTKIQCDTALSGAEGLKMLEKEKYDVVLIDHMMPEMDGVEMLHLIKENDKIDDKDAIYIALTANAISGARETYLQEGFVDYLSKPVDGSKLEKMMQKYIPEEKQMKKYSD